MEKCCEECGELINKKRLLAKPNTVLCITCQNLKEEKGDFNRATIEISQEINGWTFEGMDNKIIKGD
jgi:RNA polymerase-binding transcription factor DksA